MTYNKNFNFSNTYSEYTCDELAMLFDLSNRKRINTKERKNRTHQKKRCETPLVAASVMSVISGIAMIVTYIVTLA